MTKKKRSGKHVKKVELLQKKGMRRRHFIKAALISGAVLGTGVVGTFVYSLKEDNYADWYRKNLESSSGRRFVHPNFVSELTQDEQTFLRNEHIKRLNQELGYTPTIQNCSYLKEKLFTLLNIHNDIFIEYKERIKNSVSAFFAYAGIKDLIPELKFIKLDSSTEVSAPTEKTLPMHVVWKMVEVDRRDCNVLIYGKKEESGIWREFTDGDSGVIKIDYDFKFEDDEIYIENEQYIHVLTSVGNGPIYSYSTPLAESLHYAIRSVKSKYILDDMNQIWNETVRPKRMSLEQILSIRDEWLKREEGVVHAILDKFIEERRYDLGFSQNKVGKYQTHNGLDRYKYVPKLREKLDKLGASQFLQIYMTNPRELFEAYI